MSNKQFPFRENNFCHFKRTNPDWNKHRQTFLSVTRSSKVVHFIKQPRSSLRIHFRTPCCFLLTETAYKTWITWQSNFICRLQLPVLFQVVLGNQYTNYIKIRAQPNRDVCTFLYRLIALVIGQRIDNDIKGVPKFIKRFIELLFHSSYVTSTEQIRPESNFSEKQ